MNFHLKLGEQVYYFRDGNLCRGTIKEVRRKYADITDASMWNHGRWEPSPYKDFYIEGSNVFPSLAEAVESLCEKNSSEIATMRERILLLQRISEEAMEATP